MVTKDAARTGFGDIVGVTAILDFPSLQDACERVLQAVGS